MNELIKVETNSQGQQLVSARELHQFLEVKTDFKDWMPRMLDYGFKEDVDFSSFLSESNGGRPSKDYVLKLDCAKQIAMIQRTEKGKKAREYFIECEKKLMNPQPLNPIELIIQSAQQMLVIQQEQEKQAERIAILEAKQTSETNEYYTIAGYCALRGLKKNVQECNILGRKASKMSKELDYKIGTAYSEIFGKVNSYHLDILSQILK